MYNGRRKKLFRKKFIGARDHQTDKRLSSQTCIILGFIFQDIDRASTSKAYQVPANGKLIATINSAESDCEQWNKVAIWKEELYKENL